MPLCEQKDLNLRPPRCKRGILTGLNYAHAAVVPVEGATLCTAYFIGAANRSLRFLSPRLTIRVTARSQGVTLHLDCRPSFPPSECPQTGISVVERSRTFIPGTQGPNVTIPLQPRFKRQQACRAVTATYYCMSSPYLNLSVLTETRWLLRVSRFCRTSCTFLSRCVGSTAGHEVGGDTPPPSQGCHR